MLIHGICAVCACVLSIIMLLLSDALMVQEIPTVCYDDIAMPEDSVSVLNDVIMYTVNSRLEGRNVYMEAEDPQLLFQFRGKKRRVSSVGLLLAEEFQHEVICTLFYPTAEGEYIEERKDVFTLPKGKRMVYFEIPEEQGDRFGELRVDIDEDYTIEDILISKQPVSDVCRPVQKKWPAGIYFVVWFALLELFLYFRTSLTGQFVYIWQRRRGIVRMALLLAGGVVAGNGVAFLMFRLTGRVYSSYWIVQIGLCSAIMAYELYLLCRKEPSFQAGKKGETARTTQAVFWCCILIFCLMIAFEWWEGSERISELSGIIRFSFPFAFAIAEVVMLALLFRKYILNEEERRISFFSTYLFLFALLGIGYMLVFQPFISPDEPSHYVSAYRVSNLMLGDFSQWGEERLFMRMEDYRLFDQRSIVMNSSYYMQNTENFTVFARENGYVAVDAPMVTNAVFSYLPTGFGIAVARLLHLSAWMTFYAGRLANLVFFLLVLRYLMKKIPFGRTALFAIAMMPMVLHTAASYSYDVAIFCFVALFVTQVMCMICARERVPRRDYLLCLFFAALLGPSKVVYLPLLFLVLLVPDDRLADSRKDAWKKKGLVIAVGIAAAAAVTFAVSFSNAHSTLRNMLDGDAGAQVLTWTDEPGYSVSWILSHPWDYLLMNVRTLITMIEYYFFTMLGSWLGWLDVKIPYVYAVVSFLLFILAINIRDDASEGIRISYGRKIWILLLSMGSVLAVILVMAVSWTPTSYNYILGVQGRYFLPLLLPAIWLFRNDVIRVESVIRKHVVLFEVVLNMWVLVYVFAENIMR